MNNPSIYINGRFLTQPMTGVARYAYGVCRALIELGIDYNVICPKKEVLPCYDIKGIKIIHYGRCGSHLWEQCVLPTFFIGKHDYLLYNFTGVGPLLIRNKVMTIHDVSFLANPSWFSKSYYLWYKVMTPLAIMTSRYIITVSEFSKSEIKRFYPFLKDEKICVAYGAPDYERFRPIDLTKPKERFLLTVSSLDPRKNFSRLIEAVQGIKDCKLYIVGGQNKIFKGGNVHENDNVRYLGYVSDEDLLKLYNSADAFIFPSIYEGFGLPPIEAMACGCPVMVSDIPVLREVCGDVAVYFDPLSVENIRATIRGFINEDEKTKSDMCDRCKRHSEKYSWKNTAMTIVRATHSTNVECLENKK